MNFCAENKVVIRCVDDIRNVFVLRPSGAYRPFISPPGGSHHRLISISALRAECSGAKENQLFSDLQLNGACVSLEEAFT